MRHRAVQAAGRDAGIQQGIYLVFHQRNQRRNNEGQIRKDECRSLKAERLASSGGQNDNGVAAPADALHRLFLQWEELVEPPAFAQNLFNPNAFRHQSQTSAASILYDSLYGAKGFAVCTRFAY